MENVIRDIENMADSVNYLVQRGQMEEAANITRKLGAKFAKYFSNHTIVYRNHLDDDMNVSDIFADATAEALCNEKVHYITLLGERTGAGLKEAKDFVEKVHYIKLLGERTGAGLKEAKDFVESVEEEKKGLT